MDYFAWGMSELVEELERRDAEIGACSHCGEPLHGLVRVHHHTEQGGDVTGR
jgi:hypothetical protein